MPRLVERKDGGYFVRHFYQENTTWQIDEAGVAFLRKCGYLPGEMFSTTLFMKLLGQGMVYTKETPRSPFEPDGPMQSLADVSLRERAREFYETLSRCDFERAFKFLHPWTRESKSHAQLETDFKGPSGSRLVSWKIKDSKSTYCGDPDITRIGHVIVDFEFQHDSGASEKLIGYKQSWLLGCEDWLLVSSGWQETKEPEG